MNRLEKLEIGLQGKQKTNNIRKVNKDKKTRKNFHKLRKNFQKESHDKILTIDIHLEKTQSKNNKKGDQELEKKNREWTFRKSGQDNQELFCIPRCNYHNGR